MLVVSRVKHWWAVFFYICIVHIQRMVMHLQFLVLPVPRVDAPSIINKFSTICFPAHMALKWILKIAKMIHVEYAKVLPSLVELH